MKIKQLFLTILVISASLIWVNHVLYKEVRWYGQKSDSVHIKEKIHPKSKSDFRLWELISGHLLSAAR